MFRCVKVLPLEVVELEDLPRLLLDVLALGDRHQELALDVVRVPGIEFFCEATFCKKQMKNEKMFILPKLAMISPVVTLFICVRDMNLGDVNDTETPAISCLNAVTQEYSDSTL